MDSFLKRVFVRAGKHTTVHGVHHTYICILYIELFNITDNSCEITTAQLWTYT